MTASSFNPHHLVWHAWIDSSAGADLLPTTKVTGMDDRTDRNPIHKTVEELQKIYTISYDPEELRRGGWVKLSVKELVGAASAETISGLERTSKDTCGTWRKTAVKVAVVVLFLLGLSIAACIYRESIFNTSK